MDVTLATTLPIAIGLSMDALAVSIASGAALVRGKLRQAVRIAAFFGLFQALMPALGWLVCKSFRETVASVDHWIAFGLLSVIGAKMIWESWQFDDEDETSRVEHTTIRLLALSIATSIDALAVGGSYAFLGVSIAQPIVIIGAVTFGACFAGVLLGARVGHWFEGRIELVGGLVLIGIGAKILGEHLLATP